MGASVSLFANRRQTQIMAEIREDNAHLQARIQSLSEETSRLKAELREIADSRCENVQVSVQKVQLETDISRCPQSNRKSIILLVFTILVVWLKEFLCHTPNCNQDVVIEKRRSKKQKGIN